MTSRILGMDVGTKRIGIALSDPTHTIATPFETLHRTTETNDIQLIIRWLEQERVERIVVGWPLETSGREGRLAKHVQKLIDKIGEKTSLPIDKWDERMSSVAAERSLIAGGTRRMARRNLVDKVAASIILQGWLDAQKNKQMSSDNAH